MHFIAEAGSCHMNNKDYIKEFVETAFEAGADSVKFQLFPDTPEFTSTGNIAISRENFEFAYNMAPSLITASVFTENDLDYLISLKPSYIKFAFSKRNETNWFQKCIDAQIPIIITTTIWDAAPVNAVKLVTAYQGNEAVYPNPYMMDFSGLFPEYFQGYSDHSIGWHNAHQSKLAGAQYVEKHMKLDKPDIKCPDAVFASSDFSKIGHFK